LRASEYPKCFFVSELVEGGPIDGDNPIAGLEATVLVGSTVLIHLVDYDATL
jgi:hypothetical protein